MGGESVNNDTELQDRKPRKNISVEWYLSYFGLTTIFELSTVDDLNKQFTDSSLNMSSEQYDQLIELAEKTVSKSQRYLNKLDQRDIDMCKTPAELEQLIQSQKVLASMSPRDFWMLFNG